MERCQTQPAYVFHGSFLHTYCLHTTLNSCLPPQKRYMFFHYPFFDKTNGYILPPDLTCMYKADHTETDNLYSYIEPAHTHSTPNKTEPEDYYCTLYKKCPPGYQVGTQNT